MKDAPVKIETPCHCGLLRKAMRHLSQEYDAALAPSGLKTTQFGLLVAVHNDGEEPLSMAELAAGMVMDRSTFGHNLRPLERDGLVRIEADPNDARRRRVVLTGKGRELLLRAVPLWQEVNARCEAAYDASRGKGGTAALREALLHLAVTDFSGAGRN